MSDTLIILLCYTLRKIKNRPQWSLLLSPGRLAETSKQLTSKATYTYDRHSLAPLWSSDITITIAYTRWCTDQLLDATTARRQFWSYCRSDRVSRRSWTTSARWCAARIAARLRSIAIAITRKKFCALKSFLTRLSRSEAIKIDEESSTPLD